MSRRCRDAGSSAAELVVLTPVLVLCALFVFWCGRLGQARSLVDLAASRGARAASLVSRARMETVGRAEAVDALRSNGVSCASVSVAVEVLAEHVRVAVRCVTDAVGLEPLDARTLAATALAPIDYFRAE